MSKDKLVNNYKEIIRLISSKANLTKTLVMLIKSIESQFARQHIHSYITLYDLSKNEFTRTISPSLPKEVTQYIKVHCHSLSDGTSPNVVFFKRNIISSDRKNKMIWNHYAPVASKHGYDTHGSIPILSSKDHLLGTISFFCKNQQKIEDEMFDLLETFSQLATIAIEMDQKPNGETRNNVFYYEKEIHFKEREEEYGRIVTELNEALKNTEFEVYYQPYFGVNKPSMGMEALIRWNHPSNGLLTPAAFLKIAEETGFILEMEKWVLLQSIQEVKKLHETGFHHLTLSVNISARQLESEQFPTFISSLLNRLSFDPRLLTLEVTERFLVNKENIITLNKLKELGVKISIDDFGTAYSSLQYLKDLPVDEVKIDRSFIYDIEKNVTNQKIVEMIILLGHQLNMKIVAEGVETKQQYHLLKEMGCDVVQGFLFSRPLPFQSFQQKFFQEGNIGGLRL